MVFEVREQTGERLGAIARIAELERENRELRRANEILKAPPGPGDLPLEEGQGLGKVARCHFRPISRD